MLRSVGVWGKGGCVIARLRVPSKNSRDDRAAPREAARVGRPRARLAHPPPPCFPELIKGNVTSAGGRASLQQLTVTITYASLY